MMRKITVGDNYFLSFTNDKALTLSFGPLEVKILKFVSETPPEGAGWSKVWSNHGKSKIDHLADRVVRFHQRRQGIVFCYRPYLGTREFT